METHGGSLNERISLYHVRTGEESPDERNGNPKSLPYVPQGVTISSIMTTPEVELSNMAESAETKDSPVIEANCIIANATNSDNKTSQEPAKINTDESEQSQMEDQNGKNGVHNPVFMEEDGSIEETQPSLTYIDFLPKPDMLNTMTVTPIYPNFSTLVEQANEWLQMNKEWSLWKCETVSFKLKKDQHVPDQDSSVAMESAFGGNKYVSGLRLWLVPNMNSLPVSQIGFTTALPGTQEDDSHVRVAASSTIQDSVEHLNKQFTKKPLPGVILNIELVDFKENKSSGSMTIDPNRTSWEEKGSDPTVVVQAIRVFFILGKSEFVKIGFHDEFPSIQHTSMSFGIKCGPFRDAVFKMGAWLKEQKGIRLVHLQSISAVVDMSKADGGVINPNLCSYTERNGFETRYVKYLRAFYVYRKSDEKPYASVNLHTRLFTPVKREGDFESFSKTMQRTIKWLDHTRVPPFSVETLKYQVNVSADNMGDLDNRVHNCVQRGAGRYQLSTIRLYFPSEFIEPPPEISPEVDTQAGWGCVVS